MMFSSIFELAAVEKIGWVLLHSTWQILLIGLVYSIAKPIFRTPRSRYAIGMACLFVATIAPIATYFSLPTTVSSQPGTVVSKTNPDQRFTSTHRLDTDLPIQESSASTTASTVPTKLEVSPASDTSPSETAPSQTAAPSPENWLPNKLSLVGLLRPATPWLVMGWLCGVALLSLRPIFGWHFANKARSQGLHPAPQKIIDSVKRIASHLGVRHPIAVYESTLAKVPMVVGYLKPVILLPISAVTQLTTHELESILRHEIAHIRRYDTIVNFVQTVIETVLFYHPCVWWISNQVRIERENCCDDLAAGNPQQAMSLAQALLRLEEIRLGDHAVVAANGGDLKSRVSRLLNNASHSRPKHQRKGIAAAIATTSLVMIIASFIGLATLERNADNSETKFTEVVIKSFSSQSDWNQFKVDRQEDITRLLNHFPEAGENQTGDPPTGYEIDYQLIFANEKNDRVAIGVSLSNQLWSEGNGDWPLKRSDEFTTLISEMATKYFRPSADKPDSQLIEKELDEKIKQLGGIHSSSEFNSQAYMEFADSILDLETDRREQLLRKWARTNNDQVILLCRMLFQAKPNGQFRRPKLGEPFFLGTTDKKAWPLEPIALVDNVPFLVVRGYILAGLAETADKYLDYCLEKCDWTTQNYQGSTQKKLAFALSKIPNRAFLDKQAMEILEKQITTRPISELDELVLQMGSWDRYSNQQRNVQFSSPDYVHVAHLLMKLSEADRIKHLERWSWINELNDPVIVLCRMLFQARPDEEFRRPGLGSPVYLDGEASQWPLEPVAIVNQIPVAVVRGYDLAGQPEPANAYLDYCLKSCQWTSNDYSKFDLDAAKAVLDRLNEQGFKVEEAIRSWKQQLQLPFDNLKVYESEKARLQREHQGEWMVIAQEKVHGPFASIEEADKQVPGKSRLIFRPGFDDTDVKFPLSPFFAKSPQDFIQFGRSFAVDHQLTISTNSWLKKDLSIGLHDGRAEFVMSSPDGKTKVTRRAVCSGLFADQLAITEHEVRELGLERFRVPGVATYAPKHPGYKVFVKVEISGLEIEEYLLAYVIPNEVTETTDPSIWEEDKNAIEDMTQLLLDQPTPVNDSPPVFNTWKMVGKVTDTTGKPLANAEVRMATGYATLLGGGSTTSDADGNYELEFGEGVGMQDPATQVAWCFVSHSGYVYHSNSRGIDLSMAMSRQELTKEQLQQSAFPNIEPKDLIVRGRLHQFDIVMSRPAEVLATVVDEKGNRISENGLQLDDSNQTSEVCGIELSDEEKEATDLHYGVRTEREWRFSIPGLDRRHRIQASPMVFPKSERYQITFVRTGQDAETSLEIQSVVTADGKDVTDTVVNLDPLTLPPLPEERQAEGRDLLRQLADRNQHWLFPSKQDAIDGGLKAKIIRNGEEEWIETSHPSSLQPTHYSSLHIAAADPTQAIIRAINKQGNNVEIAFTLSNPGRQSFGNGLAGKFNGFVQTNVYSGVVTIDAETMTPIQHQSGEFIASFLEFKQLTDESFVPGEIQIRGNLNCDWKFQLLEGELYVLDELSATVGDRKLTTTVERIEVDGKELSAIKDEQ